MPAKYPLSSLRVTPRASPTRSNVLIGRARKHRGRQTKICRDTFATTMRQFRSDKTQTGSSGFNEKSLSRLWSDHEDRQRDIYDIFVVVFQRDRARPHCSS